MAFSAFPAAPSITQPSTFASRASAWVSHFTNVFIPELIAAMLGYGPGQPYCTVGGTANARTLTTGLNLGALVQGQIVRFRAPATNTGATTINVDGLGAKAAKTPTRVALPSGFLRTDVNTAAEYDEAEDCWIVYREMETGEATAGAVTTRWAKDGSGSLVQWYERDASTDQWLTAVGSFYASASTYTWTFDVPFVGDLPDVTPWGSRGGGDPSGASWGTRSLTATTLRPWSATSNSFEHLSATPKAFGAMASGRWY